MSCKQDAEPTLQENPTNNVTVTERATCTDPNYCNCSVTSDADITLGICGSLPTTITSCTTAGCNIGDKGMEGVFPANTPREFCVSKNGSVCVTNTGSSTVNVTIKFGSSSGITVQLAPSATSCFHTNGDCSTTNNGCS